MSNADRERRAQQLAEQRGVEILDDSENDDNITNTEPEKRPQVTQRDDYSRGYESSDGDRQINSGKYNKSKSKPDEKDMCVFTGDGSLVPCPEEYLIKRNKAREAYRKRKALLAKKGKRSPRKSAGRKGSTRKSPARKGATRKKSTRKGATRKGATRKSPARKRSTRKGSARK
jgi:hypothetical protein